MNAVGAGGTHQSRERPAAELVEAINRRIAAFDLDGLRGAN